MSIEFGRNYVRAGIGRFVIVLECDPQLSDWAAVRSNAFPDGVTFREVVLWPFAIVLEASAPAAVNAAKSEAV